MRRELINLRDKAKLTQETVAAELGISRSSYGHIETGARNPTYFQAKKIAKLFGVLVEDIFFECDSFRMKQYQDKN
ncbi:helix-turn-helix transcriptional regulator [Desulfosporosinus shakirovi]|uniref:helix-turn-helix transcriptional regulator n=1 Tax=Desulfosporosinus shakirovi TaxID=2885154 RepID=UPI001E4D0066|nr:helix-turn-helix domain-containing protein [Desulfosporosinus sp. SRJS8]MCB8818654.1 helix-turn-helix domain-containing protein [Desulfosporosinus sp. SRJS8]